MNIPLWLGIAYAVVAALLLNLNLASPWRREIKIAAIFLVTALYVVVRGQTFALHHGAVRQGLF